MKPKLTKVLFFGRESCPNTLKCNKMLSSMGCEIMLVYSRYRGEALPQKALDWEGDFIFSFRSMFIIPEELIRKAKIAAINFHPGPPEYPGTGCINFALYDRAATFGVTAHHIVPKIDSGRIIKVLRFGIEPSDTVSSLLARSHARLFELFSFIILRTMGHDSGEQLEALTRSCDDKWSGDAKTLSDLEKLKSISPYIDETELQRLIRATYFDGYPPYINFHGYKFELKDPMLED